MEMNLRINVGDKLQAFKDWEPGSWQSISANLGLKFCSIFGFYLPMYCLE